MSEPQLPEAALRLLGPEGPYELQTTLIDGFEQVTFKKAPVNLGEL